MPQEGPLRWLPRGPRGLLGPNMANMGSQMAPNGSQNGQMGPSGRIYVAIRLGWGPLRTPWIQDGSECSKGSQGPSGAPLSTYGH